MKPSRFVYHAPTGLEQALELLAEYRDDAKALWSATANWSSLQRSSWPFR